jgi:hypothetical protein
LADFLDILAAKTGHQLKDKSTGRSIVKVKQTIPSIRLACATTPDKFTFVQAGFGVLRWVHDCPEINRGA